MTAQDFPAEFGTPQSFKDKPETMVLRGGSCIIAPDGNFVVSPVFDE